MVCKIPGRENPTKTPSWQGECACVGLWGPRAGTGAKARLRLPDTNHNNDQPLNQKQSWKKKANTTKVAGSGVTASKEAT